MARIFHYMQYFTTSTIILFQSCKEPYNSPVISQPHHYLVVDGFINNGGPIADIILSRSRNLSDTTVFDPELGDEVSLIGDGGEFYKFTETANGHYVYDNLNLNNSHQYKLVVHTGNGGQYESDYVPVKITPEIDSINWNRGEDVVISVSTHDPANNTWYYRWDYDETWEYHAQYETDLAYDYNTQMIYSRTPDQYSFKCWDSDLNGETTIGTSAQLKEDIISRYPVAVIPKGSNKLEVRYSIQVRQYALTEDGFKFWQLLKKSSEQLGTLFDPLPAQLIGNIHCLNNPDEPVIGYVSISTTTTKRAFIRRSEVPSFEIQPNVLDCNDKYIPDDPVLIREALSDTSLTPAFYLHPIGGGVIVHLAKRECVYCNLLGGTLVKPGYW